MSTSGLPTPEEEGLYWKNNFVFKLLRFLNLLEPGRTVLSLSKLLVWINIVVVAYVMVYHPDQIVAVIGASVSAAATMLNYAWRRYIFHKSENAPTALPRTPEAPAGPSVDER
jgi:hypothetical protein